MAWKHSGVGGEQVLRQIVASLSQKIDDRTQYNSLSNVHNSPQTGGKMPPQPPQQPPKHDPWAGEKVAPAWDPHGY